MIVSGSVDKWEACKIMKLTKGKTQSTIPKKSFKI